MNSGQNLGLWPQLLLFVKNKCWGEMGTYDLTECKGTYRDTEAETSGMGPLQTVLSESPDQFTAACRIQVHCRVWHHDRHPA